MKTNIKYVQIYRSLYNTIVKANLSDADFRRVIMPLLEYGFEGIEPDPKGDMFLMAVYEANKPFIDKAEEDLTNGKKGGRPRKTPQKPDKEKESETETDKETDNDIPSSVSPPQTGGSTSGDDWQSVDEKIARICNEERVSKGD